MMDGHHFDELLHALTASRRSLFSGGLTVAAGWLGGAAVTARKKRKKKTKLKRNAFGCVDVGQACRGNSGNCCSGLCEGKKPKQGKKDKSRCVDHNAGICGAESDLCTSGVAHFCHPSNANCVCMLTTGNAGFCGDFTSEMGQEVQCRVCRTDPDCQDEFGPGAACLSLGGISICAESCAATGGTACAPPCA